LILPRGEPFTLLLVHSEAQVELVAGLIHRRSCGSGKVAAGIQNDLTILCGGHYLGMVQDKAPVTVGQREHRAVVAGDEACSLCHDLVPFD